MKHERTGAALREAREAAGISAVDLAKEIGISHATLYRFEAGDIPASCIAFLRIVRRVIRQRIEDEMITAALDAQAWL